MLELHNEDLLNIDPFSPELTDQEKTAIIEECTINPWYFLREIVRIPDNGELKPFELTQGNTAMLYLFFNGINTAVCLPSMCGKTTSALCGILWYYSSIDNQNILFGNRTIEESIDNLDKFNTIRYALPDYIRHIKELNTIMTIGSEEAYESDYTIQIFDNYESIKNIDSIVSKATSSYNETRQCGCICISTPGDLSTNEGESSSKVIANTMDFDERMYDMTTQGLRSFVSTYSDNNTVYIQYHYHQLRKDTNWYNQMKSLYDNEYDIKRKILLERFSSTDYRPETYDELRQRGLCKMVSINIDLMDNFVDIMKI